MRRRWFTLLLALAAPLAPSARADEPESAVRALEEELNTLKEAQEKADLEVRKLRERSEKQAQTLDAQNSVIADLRKRLQEAEALKTQIQGIEARLAELGEGGGKKSQSPVDFGLRADVRIRPEISSNRTDFDGGDENDDRDAFWGHRVRLGIDLGVEDWVRTRIRFQDARVFGQTTTSGDGIGLHEGWAEVSPPWAQGLTIRAGRTELAYGRERLVGTDDFGLTGQAFDGGFIRYEFAPYISLDAFYAKTRESAGVEGDGDFFGIYASTSGIPFTTLDVYYMGLLDELDVQEPTANGQERRLEERNIHTLGARVELLASGFLFEGEAMFQLGSRTDPVDPTRELDHFATAYHAEISYQIPVLTLPALGAFFTWASGDANPSDGSSVDFNPLFPSRQAYLGKMNLFNLTNIMDVGGFVELTPPRGFGAHFAFHYFRLPNTSGPLPGGFGAGKTPDPTSPDLARQAIGNNVGYEIDLVLSWAPSDLISLEGGYSVFLPKQVIQSLGGGTDAAHWAYLQFRVQY